MKASALPFLALAVACQSNQALEPVEPVWGKVACKHCSMLVTETHPAAQAVLSDGVRAYFDDVGCMALFLDHEKATPRMAWANDGKGSWVAVNEARFAGGQRTPMDFGFLIAPGGAATFEDVREAARNKAHRSKP